MSTKKYHSLPTKFSPFAWGLGLFCTPIVFYPIGLLLSPNIMDNPHLSDGLIRMMIVFLWSYPVLLLGVARIWYVVHRRKPKLSRYGLLVSGIGFYLIIYLISKFGFIYHFN